MLRYADSIGWTYVSQASAEVRRGFDPSGATPEDRARPANLYFGDVLHSQLKKFNPSYKAAEGAIIGELQKLPADIAGNRDHLAYLRIQTQYFDPSSNRELDLKLIDY